MSELNEPPELMELVVMIAIYFLMVVLIWKVAQPSSEDTASALNKLKVLFTVVLAPITYVLVKKTADFNITGGRF